MYEKIRFISAERIPKNEQGKVDFHTIDVPQIEDYSRICYYKFYVTAQMLTDEIRALRTEHKRAMIKMPHDLSKDLKAYIFSLADGAHMRDVQSEFKFEMGLDLRSAL